MKYSYTGKTIVAGLVTGLAIMAALGGGLAPKATAHAADAATTLSQATPTVRISATSTTPVVRVARKLRTATVAPAAARQTRATRKTTYLESAGELGQARTILATLIKKYPVLAGTTVTIGTTPNNYQAVCYYRSARIVVSPKHTASLSTILNHEVWHVIDWRDNGRIDWGENIPR